MDAAAAGHRKPLFAARTPPWYVLLLLFTIVALFTVQTANRSFPSLSVPHDNGDESFTATYEDLLKEKSCAAFFSGMRMRSTVAVSIEEFGGVGDGVSSNTAAFRKAIRYLRCRWIAVECAERKMAYWEFQSHQ